MTCSLDCKLCRGSYRITDGNCMRLDKWERVKLVRHVLPVLPTTSNARYDGCAGPRTYVVYVSADAESIAIQHDGHAVPFSLLTLAVTQRGNEQEATKLQKQVITNDLWHCLLLEVSSDHTNGPLYA